MTTMTPAVIDAICRAVDPLYSHLPEEMQGPARETASPRPTGHCSGRSSCRAVQAYAWNVAARRAYVETVRGRRGYGLAGDAGRGHGWRPALIWPWTMPPTAYTPFDGGDGHGTGQAWGVVCPVPAVGRKQ